MFDGTVRIAKHGFVTKQIIDAVGFLVFMKALVFGELPIRRFCLRVFPHLLVERTEEQVLQDGLVVAAGIGVQFVQDFQQIGFVKQLFRDQAFFLEKPAEDQSGKQSNQGSSAAFLIVLFGISRKFDLRKCPEIPVGQFAVEAFVQKFDVEDFFPSGVQIIEGVDRLSLRVFEVLQCEGVENI